MKRDDEAYIFDQECLTSLNNAWRIVSTLQKVDTDRVLTWAAYRMALIEYSKPFKCSFGEGERRHRLRDLPVTDADLSLHKYILNLRDSYLAHSDIRAKDAKLHYFEDAAGSAYPPMITANIDPAPPTMAAAQGLVERMIDIVEARVAEEERQFASVRQTPL